MLSVQKKMVYQGLVKCIQDIDIPKEYCGRQKGIKPFAYIREPPFFIPETFSKGGCLVVGNRDGNLGVTDDTFAGALRNKKNRKEIKQINDAYTDDFLKQAAYFQYNFNLNENKKIKEIRAFVFCRFLEILEPRVIIIFGNLNYLAKKEFEEFARRIWPDLKDAPNGKVLKTRYNVNGLEEFDGVKKERELKELEHMLNDLGRAIADVHDVFKFVDSEVDSDVKKDYFEDEDFFDGKTCEQKLESQYILMNQWGKIRERKYRLEKGEDADGIIENVKIMYILTDFLYDTSKVLSFSDIKYAMSCISWIRGNGSFCNDKDGFYELLKCALDKNKIPPIEMEAYLKNLPPREGRQSGFYKVLDAIYDFLVTVTTPQNSRCAHRMERSFFKAKTISGLQDSSKWKNECDQWNENIEYWLPSKPELMRKKVDWRHVNWHLFLENN